MQPWIRIRRPSSSLARCSRRLASCSRPGGGSGALQAPGPLRQPCLPAAVVEEEGVQCMKEEEKEQEKEVVRNTKEAEMSRLLRKAREVRRRRALRCVP